MSACASAAQHSLGGELQSCGLIQRALLQSKKQVSPPVPVTFTRLDVATMLVLPPLHTPHSSTHTHTHTRAHTHTHTVFVCLSTCLSACLPSSLFIDMRLLACKLSHWIRRSQMCNTFRFTSTPPRTYSDE